MGPGLRLAKARLLMWESDQNNPIHTPPDSEARLCWRALAAHLVPAHPPRHGGRGPYL